MCQNSLQELPATILFLLSIYVLLSFAPSLNLDPLLIMEKWNYIISTHGTEQR